MVTLKEESTINMLVDMMVISTLVKPHLGIPTPTQTVTI
jgi:hypothetical protein